MKKNKLLQAKDIFCKNTDLTSLAPLVYEGILNQFQDSSVLEEKFLEDIKNDINKKISSANISLGYRNIFLAFQPYDILSAVLKIPIPYSTIKDKICLKK